MQSTRLFLSFSKVIYDVKLSSEKNIQAPAGNARRFSSTYKHLKLTFDTPKRKNILTVTIDRPDIHNAFDEVLIDELSRAFKSIPQAYPKCNSVILTGVGASFSAGADLNWMKKMVFFNLCKKS
jgi:1,4-dihydroxy-2-naphthoyl-CoA synthase